MPKRVQARAAQNEQEEREVRKLARSHHAPSDWKFHARMIIQSWAGKSPQEIATELKCHPKTVRTHLARFTREGISGLGMRSGSGGKPRLTELERSRILALVKLPPPGRLERRSDEMVARDEQGAAQWSLDALTEAAHAAGIQVQRSPHPSDLYPGRRALAPYPQLGKQRRRRLCPKRTAVVTHYTQPPAGSTTVCTDELGPVIPRTFAPAPGWSADGHRIKAPLDYSRGEEKVWV